MKHARTLRGRGRPLGSGTHVAKLHVRMPRELLAAIHEQAERDGVRPAAFLRLAAELYTMLAEEVRRAPALWLATHINLSIRTEVAAKGGCEAPVENGAQHKR